MRIVTLAASLLILSGTALAQPAPEQMPPGPPPGATPPPPEMTAPVPPPPPGRRMKMRDRFEQANTTHDGRLTLQQAQAASWRPVARNFAAIDRDQKGYVTLQDIKDWMRARRAARAAQQPPQPQPPQP